MEQLHCYRPLRGVVVDGTVTLLQATERVVEDGTVTLLQATERVVVDGTVTLYRPLRG